MILKICDLELSKGGRLQNPKESDSELLVTLFEQGNHHPRYRVNGVGSDWVNESKSVFYLGGLFQ